MSDVDLPQTGLERDMRRDCRVLRRRGCFVMTAAGGVESRAVSVAALVVAACIGAASPDARAAGLLDALRDPFAIPARVVRAMTAPPPPVAPAPASGASRTPTEPSEAAKVVEPPAPDVRAVLLAGADSMANVGGAILRVGDAVEGHRLIEIRARGAVFKRDDGKTVTVNLDQPRRGTEHEKR